MEKAETAAATWARCKGAVQAALRHRDRMLPYAEEAATIMEKTYKIGEANLLELLDARRVLLGARVAWLTSVLEANIELSRLRSLAGEEI
jgi:outer membrane protein TolC